MPLKGLFQQLIVSASQSLSAAVRERPLVVMSGIMFKTHFDAFLSVMKEYQTLGCAEKLNEKVKIYLHCIVNSLSWILLTRWCKTQLGVRHKRIFINLGDRIRFEMSKSDLFVCFLILFRILFPKKRCRTASAGSRSSVSCCSWTQPWEAGPRATLLWSDWLITPSVTARGSSTRKFMFLLQMKNRRKHHHSSGKGWQCIHTNICIHTKICENKMCYRYAKCAGVFCLFVFSKIIDCYYSI